MRTLFRALCPFLLLCLPLFAQAQRGQQMKNITEADQEELLIRLSVFFKENHINKGQAEAAGDSLMARFSRGEYRKVSENVAEFTEKINHEIQVLLHDGTSGFEMPAQPEKNKDVRKWHGSYGGKKNALWYFFKWSGKDWLGHIRLNNQTRSEEEKQYRELHGGEAPIFFDTKEFKENKNTASFMMPSRLTFSPQKAGRWQQTIAEKDTERTHALSNFGHGEIRMLDNGAAYWKINYWAVPATRRYDDKFKAAAALANDGSALILDLRGAAHGDPKALAFFMAAFLPKGADGLLGHLLSNALKEEIRVSKKDMESYPKFDQAKPVFILTDGQTSGVSEWAAQLLQERAGAKIIGGKTAGQSFFPVYTMFWNAFLATAAGQEAKRPDGSDAAWKNAGLTPDVAAFPAAALDSALARCPALPGWETADLFGVEQDSLKRDWEKCRRRTQPDSLTVSRFLGGYSLQKNISWKNGFLCLTDSYGGETFFREMEAGVFMSSWLFGENRPTVVRGGGQRLGQDFMARLPIKPLYLSFPAGPNPDMTVIYTNGRHYTFEREGKTNAVEDVESENPAEKNYDLFADTAKTAERFNAVLEQYPGEMEGTEAAPLEFTDMEGEYLSSGNFTGNKAVVLNFWFAACAPCVAEMPAFNALKEKYADQDVSFIAINRYDDSEKILKFLKKHPFNFHLIANDEDQKTAVEKALADYKAVVFPTTVLIGKDGKIKFARAGYLPEYSGMLDRAIKRELGL